MVVLEAIASTYTLPNDYRFERLQEDVGGPLEPGHLSGAERQARKSVGQEVRRIALVRLFAFQRSVLPAGDKDAHQ